MDYPPTSFFHETLRDHRRRTGRGGFVAARYALDWLEYCEMTGERERDELLPRPLLAIGAGRVVDPAQAMRAGFLASGRQWPVAAVCPPEAGGVTR